LKRFKLMRKNQTEGMRNGIAGSASDVVVNTMISNDKIGKKLDLYQWQIISLFKKPKKDI
jgi:hypothetical protein